MKRLNNAKWTEAENKLLQEYYLVLSMDSLYSILPGRDLNSIIKQVQTLKRQNRRFEHDTT